MPDPHPHRLVPGDRRVWLAAALVAAVGAVAITVALLVPRDYYTGTDSVRTRSFATLLNPGDRLCVSGLDLPAGTGRVQMEVWNSGNPLPTFEGTVETERGTIGRTRVPASPRTRAKVEFPIQERPATPATTAATVCVRPEGTLAVGGMEGLQGNDTAPTLNGASSPNRVAVWFLPPAGEKKTLLAQLPTIFERASLFRPGFVGPWTYWIVLFVWMPLVAYGAVRLLATAGERSPRRTAALLAAVAFANTAAWALVTPAFNSPDEPEHFAAVQFFGETGQRVARKPIADRMVLSSQQQFALDAIRLPSMTESPDGRPPWIKAEERRFDERLSAEPSHQDDGGGNAIATQLNDPLYYATIAPAYLAAQGSSTFTQLTAMRLWSALYGIVVVLCAFAIVRELLPRQPLAAVAAGLVVAFEPMFAFISGSVNNDAGVNAAAALVIYLTVRALRRGLTPRTAALLALALVALPAMKPTGFSLYPLVALALAGMIWRRHERADVRAYAALAGTFALAFVAWELFVPVFNQSAPAIPGGGNDVEITSVPGRHDIPGYLSYLWQVFLPPLPGMTDRFLPRLPFYDIYVVRGFGAFGWYAVHFPDWVYRVVLAAITLVGAGGVAAILRHRDWARRHWMELAFIALVPFVVLAAVEAAFYVPTPRVLTAEFGRYEFPALAALGALAIGACFAFAARRARAAATVLVMAMFVLGYAAQFLTLAGFYT